MFRKEIVFPVGFTTLRLTSTTGQKRKHSFIPRGRTFRRSELWGGRKDSIRWKPPRPGTDGSVEGRESEMKKNISYDSLTRRNRFYHLLKVSIITVGICLAIIAPLLRHWDMSLQMRTALRNAKNVLLNVKYLGVQYDGVGDVFLDSSSESGLSFAAESEVRSYSGAAGDFTVVKWNSGKGRVEKLYYTEGDFSLVYENAEGDGEWKIYRSYRQYAEPKKE